MLNLILQRPDNSKPLKPTKIKVAGTFFAHVYDNRGAGYHPESDKWFENIKAKGDTMDLIPHEGGKYPLNIITEDTCSTS